MAKKKDAPLDLQDVSCEGPRGTTRTIQRKPPSSRRAVARRGVLHRDGQGEADGSLPRGKEAVVAILGAEISL